MRSKVKLAAFVALNLMAIIARGATPKMPTFFARRDYSETSNFVQIGDTNGDGIPDLIASSLGTIQVYFGNGYGTFVPGPTTTTIASGAAYSLAALDLSGDGKIDLAMATGGGVVVSLGNGNGTFESGVNYPINDNNGYLVIGDFNGDGILDIATAGPTGIWLLIGQGGGTFNSAVLVVSLANAFNIAAADFNQDGRLDLVVTTETATNAGSFAVLLGNGNGTFQTPQTFAQSQSTKGVAVGSLTKGGPPSIAINGPNGYAYLYFGNGKGGFAGPRAVNLPGGGSNGLAIGDVNGDGLPDVVTDGGYVAYGVGEGYFTKPFSYPIENAYEISNVVLADLRNNGETDIITGGYEAVSVLLNLGKGYMEDGIWASVTGGAGCGAAADFNDDGKPDLAVNTPSGVSILLGTGKYLPPFTTGTPIALAGAECLVTGDINGDGIPDLLVPVYGTVNAYLGVGNGTFTLNSTTPTPSGGYLALGDFNHDGKLDFATSGNLIAVGNGDGTFQNPSDIVANPPTGGFSGIVAGDINNDGWPDLVLTSDVFPINANATVLLNNHEGGFTQVATNFGAGTAQPILADLRGSSNLDLVLGASGGSGAFVHLGNGNGTFTSPGKLYYGPSGAATGAYSVADVNGDGIPDLLILGDDTLDVYLGQGNATYATPFSIGTGPSPAGLLLENLHGQSSKAGIPDIVAPDTSGGVIFCST
jgi:hypothetical protein